PVLANVHWYGTDGVASSAALLADPTAAAFAMQTGFPTPDLGLPPSERGRWQPVADAVAAQVGYAPNAYALTAYDIAWVAALAEGSAGSTGNTQDEEDPPMLHQARRARRLILLSALMLVFGAAGPRSPWPHAALGTGVPVTRVRLQLKWVPQAQFAGYYL